MKYSIPIFFILLSLCVSFFSCDDDDDKFSTSPNLKIEFSKDTLRFDTVFATIASPVQRLKIHNRNNNSISFESIRIMNPEKSGFRINVDGFAGKEFNNIDLFKKDSIYIRVDLKPNQQNGGVTLTRDSIELSWNGNKKYIQLGGYGLDVIIWDDKTLTSDTHMAADQSYYIRGKVDVNENVNLNISEGVTLYFDQKGSLNINGTINAVGTSSKRITLRGHRFDFFQRNVPYDNASGQWEGITVGQNSFNNIFKNVNIRNSRIGIDFAQSTTDKRKASFMNSIVHNTSEYGIQAINCDIEATNCQFSNSTGSLLTLVGGKYTFLHCTFANYYEWYPRTTSSVVLAESKNTVNFPFEKCHFINSIITGTFKDEMDLLFGLDNKSIAFNNCLLQSSAAINDDRFINTIWNIGSVFPYKDINSKKRYSYSFELADESAAISTANLQYAQTIPTDLRGISRLSDSKPDIGCYEWYQSEEEK